MGEGAEVDYGTTTRRGALHSGEVEEVSALRNVKANYDMAQTPQSFDDCGADLPAVPGDHYPHRPVIVPGQTSRRRVEERPEKQGRRCGGGERHRLHFFTGD